ncbi:MAG: hypothetical protein K0Q63_221 [Paenibacillus sp.]|nr:hypothetical protein [Paenibacillus sp.]
MSTTLLRELREELNRLYMAGSDLAAGDFRLKRLVPTFKQLGERAPVFKRLGEGVEGLIEPVAGDDRSSAERLQELTLLLSSVLHTQGQTAPEDEVRDLDGTPVDLPTAFSSRRLTEVQDALESSGGGRQEIIVQAYQDGLFRDLRLVLPAIGALNDPYAEIADYVKEHVLPSYGPQLLPLLKARIDIIGGRPDARAVEVVGKVGGDEELGYIRQAAAEGSETVRISAIGCLAGHAAYENDLLEWSADGKKAIRAAAYAALAESDGERAQARLHAAFAGKDRDVAAEVLSRRERSPLTARLARDASEALAEAGGLAGDKEKLAKIWGRLEAYLDALGGKSAPELDVFFDQVLGEGAFYHGLGWTRMVHDAARHASGQPDERVLERLLKLERSHAGYLSYAFRMSRILRTPEDVFSHYSGYVKGSYKDALVQELERALIQSSSRMYPRIWGEGEEYGREVRIPSQGELDVHWDPRWLDWAIRADAALVAGVMSRPSNSESKEASVYLMEKFRKSMSESEESFIVLWEGLDRVGVSEEERREAIVAMLESKQRGLYRFDYEMFRQLTLLPASYRDRLTALKGRYRYTSAEQLQYIIDMMSEVQA